MYDEIPIKKYKIGQTIGKTAPGGENAGGSSDEYNSILPIVKNDERNITPKLTKRLIKSCLKLILRTKENPPFDVILNLMFHFL
jgi:hypothetical protein